MSNSMANLRRKIDSAGDLQSVVRTMKALAASNIGQYEQSVLALADYYRTVELGLSACVRTSDPARLRRSDRKPHAGSATDPVNAIVFGSDQGLVGQFNDVVADFAIETLSGMPGDVQVWAVGERVHARLADSGLRLMGLFSVPTSVKAIAPLVGQIQIDTEAHGAREESARLYVFHNSPQSGAVFAPVSQRLLPLDGEWLHKLAKVDWPSKISPEVMGADRQEDRRADTTTLRALIREYLYISLFRACAESLASENASRLAAMERADKNIDELLENLHGAFHGLRQSSIDEELFDVVSGYESLSVRGN
ncbi:F0F1 ATP synthase subunit gamma [Actimicrobium antarcticum]|uniref:F0F1 ATP synthase subunit gamma n=1 Tax=Actimicrobium antarcticum TaxID=1051899 RepID=A0ABP7TDR5_9BURK